MMPQQPKIEEVAAKNPLPLAFAGGLWDKETGLVHFGHRDYDPDVGRFTTKDPIGYAGGDSDLYGYGFDDPVNLMDPWGLKAQKQKPKKWLWKANPGACEKCQALDGNVFDEYPQRPHPNCKCKIVEASEHSDVSRYCLEPYLFCLESRDVTDEDMDFYRMQVELCKASSNCSQDQLRKYRWELHKRIELRRGCERTFKFCKRGD